MFGLFKRRSSGDGPTPSLDSVRFDTNGYESGGEPHPGQVRVWFTPDGDGVGLYFFPVAPDLPPNANSVDDLRAFYTARLTSLGGELVELAVLSLDGCSAVQVVFKTCQQPSGMTYVGSFTLPFRDFSFVAKVQCEERGHTGFREAVLLDRRLATGEMSANWNPDDESFDGEFPEHPVSRVRRVLQRFAGSVAIDTAIQTLPGFKLPRG
jgi:hypothetical protein